VSELFEFLNKNAGALSALFSGVVTGATVVYAWLTWKLVTETRQLRQAQTEPRVQVIYRPRDEWMALTDIVVRNIGLGPAYDISFDVHQQTESDTTARLAAELLELGCFRTGLSYLGPGQEFFSYWTNVTEGYEEKIQATLKIHCQYKSAGGVPYVHEYLLNLSELKGLTRIGEPPLLKIAKQIEKIQNHLYALVNGMRKLKVDVFSEAERDAEAAACRDKPKSDGPAS